MDHTQDQLSSSAATEIRGLVAQHVREIIAERIEMALTHDDLDAAVTLHDLDEAVAALITSEQLDFAKETSARLDRIEAGLKARGIVLPEAVTV